MKRSPKKLFKLRSFFLLLLKLYIERPIGLVGSRYRFRESGRRNTCGGRSLQDLDSQPKAELQTKGALSWH